MEKKSKILVPAGVKKELRDELGTTYPTVREALAGIKSTDIAEKIRAAALLKGGVEVKQQN